MSSQDAERRELERVVELLGRNTRPGRLLAYVGAKYFEPQAEQLTEFTIATEVFGRSAKDFDPTQDAVVRVETHRLRKKLRELYEKDGDTHDLQICLPAGSYVPKFVAAPEQEAAKSPTGQADADAAQSATTRRKALYFTSIAGAIGAIALAVVLLDGFRSAQSPPPAATASLVEAPTIAETGAKLSEVHVMAGYSGSEVIDNSGVRWTPDRFFTGGGPWALDRGFIRGTSRPFLFANWRAGEFSYDIPLERGTYELRLFFVSPHRVGDEKLASFDVALNGKPLLTAYDVNVSARGADVADEKVFKDVRPDEDGFVRLRFTNQIGTPAVSALELAPGTPRKLKPIRIITQPTSYVDHKGRRWRADDYFFNGFRSTERHTVSGTDDPELFSAERYGHFSYAIPVDTRGRYTVVLHFAEFYFGPQRLGGGGAGSRVFNVFCNGKTLLENFDVYKEGGSLRLVTKTFTNIKPSAQGKINLTFEPVVNNATISGIEILDESA
ncbi:MAG: hypothetical protein GX535_09150 [Xanthomonadaceae bacterium]|nr:hypothetical protein [Xanthomonadaceae bacterium]